VFLGMEFPICNTPPGSEPPPQLPPSTTTHTDDYRSGGNRLVVPRPSLDVVKRLDRVAPVGYGTTDSSAVSSHFTPSSLPTLVQTMPPSYVTPTIRYEVKPSMAQLPLLRPQATPFQHHSATVDRRTVNPLLLSTQTSMHSHHAPPVTQQRRVGYVPAVPATASLMTSATYSTRADWPPY